MAGQKALFNNYNLKQYKLGAFTLHVQDLRGMSPERRPISLNEGKKEGLWCIIQPQEALQSSSSSIKSTKIISKCRHMGFKVHGSFSKSLDEPPSFQVTLAHNLLQVGPRLLLEFNSQFNFKSSSCWP